MFKDRSKGLRPSAARSIVSFIILALVLLLIYTTGVTRDFGEEKLSLKSSFYSVDVPYSTITDIELRDTLEKGSRINGIGTFTVAGGHFRNSEFGSYNLFISTKVNSYIVIHSGNVVTVFNMTNVEDTKAAYELLKSKTA